MFNIVLDPMMHSHFFAQTTCFFELKFIQRWKDQRVSTHSNKCQSFDVILGFDPTVLPMSPYLFLLPYHDLEQLQPFLNSTRIFIHSTITEHFLCARHSSGCCRIKLIKTIVMEIILQELDSQQTSKYINKILIVIIPRKKQ